MKERVPPLGEDEVRIQVHYAGMNFADMMARGGFYPGAPKPPFTTGLEAAGTILECGRFSDQFSRGDKVAALIPGFGGHADILNVPARYVRRLSETADLLEASAVPAVYLTALMMLDMVRPDPGDSILVFGAGGGVGTALLNLARLRGLRVIGAASRSKHEKLASLKPDLILETGDHALREKVMSFTNGNGVDAVFDSRGFSAFRSSYKLLAPLGTLVMFGIQNISPGRRFSFRTLNMLCELFRVRFSPLKMMFDNRIVAGFSLARLPGDPRSVRAFDEVIRLFEGGEIHAVVDRTFPAEDVRSAHRYIAERKNFGKVVLDFTDMDRTGRE
jgi:NADPH:quinone reductase-like Zn-dependent oxidoreductase